MLKLKDALPAPITPFKEDRSLDLSAYERLVEAVIGDGMHGLLISGCTSESRAVTDEEHSSIHAALSAGFIKDAVQAR
jgi:dihydrodipicolinate synthase/N-acetylneuraminate lyase